MRKVELVNMAFLGDRLVDTAYSLGVHPRLMATAFTPMIESKLPLSRQVECTACVLSNRRSPFFPMARKMGIERVILEKSSDEVDPSSAEQRIRALGFHVEIVDFSRGIETGIRETCSALGMNGKAQRHIDRYRVRLDEARGVLPKKVNKRVLILLGMVRDSPGDEYLLVEERGSINTHILDPAGCINVSSEIEPDERAEDTPEIRVIKELTGLVEAAPDIIALTCAAAPGLKAIHRIAAKFPEALRVPALAKHAIFSLPHCCEAAPMELPSTIRSWAEALLRYTPG